MSQGVVMGKNSMVPLSNVETCLIALGSNLGFDGEGPALVLDAAISALEQRGYVIRARSRYYNTPAFPAGAGPDFVNAVIAVSGPVDLQQVLADLHSVEAEMGRLREVRWGARTLDLDLIAAGAQVLPDLQTHQYWRELPLAVQKTTAPQELIVPHPRLSERAFVLVPLMDVAPDWCHPATGMTVGQMHDALPQALKDEVVAL